MNSKYAPIVLFVYNRPDHLVKVLDCLSKIRDAEHSELYIYSDQAKNENMQAAVDEVRNIAHRYAEKSPFLKVHIVEAEQNKGLAVSIISGVSNVIKTHGRAIVLEDDLLVSKDFLEYMNGALDFYKERKEVFQISGYSFNMKAFKKYEHSVYRATRCCSWGWATWSDRWFSVDWDMHDYNKVKWNPIVRSKFGAWGYDMPYMLDSYMCGQAKSWAIRYCWAAFKQNKHTIYPVSSRVKNIGIDGSGTNSSANSAKKYIASFMEDHTPCKFESLQENKAIKKEFARRYMSLGMQIKGFIRWTLIKSHILELNK